MMNGEDILRKAKELAQKETECTCPTLFRIAVERNISLKQLRDEIRLLISMSDDELDTLE